MTVFLDVNVGPADHLLSVITVYLMWDGGGQPVEGGRQFVPPGVSAMEAAGRRKTSWELRDKLALSSAWPGETTPSPPASPTTRLL